jgi:hypothetical protein
MSKILIIDHEPFTNHKNNRFYLTQFKDDGFDVEYWSVYKALKYSKKINYFNVEKSDNVFYIDSYEDLLQKIELINKSTIVILEIFFNWDTIFIFWKLKKNKVKIYKIDYFLNTSTYFHQSSSTNILNQFLTLQLGQIFHKIFRKLNSYFLISIANFLKINKYDTIFLTGSKISHLHTNEKKISINYFDVETSKSLNKIKNNKESYVVFLDINLPNHPDLARSKNVTISDCVYYKKLTFFFDSIVEKTGFKVKIAAHPQSNYNNEFGIHEFFYCQTAELVANSEYVLLHNSASFNFALLSNKPMVFIYLDEFRESNNYLSKIFSSMEIVSSYFKCPLINIDDENLDFLNEISFDSNKYLKFLDEVIFSVSYPKSNYDIIKENI